MSLSEVASATEGRVGPFFLQRAFHSKADASPQSSLYRVFVDVDLCVGNFNGLCYDDHVRSALLREYRRLTPHVMHFLTLVGQWASAKGLVCPFLPDGGLEPQVVGAGPPVMSRYGWSLLALVFLQLPASTLADDATYLKNRRPAGIAESRPCMLPSLQQLGRGMLQKISKRCHENSRNLADVLRQWTKSEVVSCFLNDDHTPSITPTLTGVDKRLYPPLRRRNKHRLYPAASTLLGTGKDPQHRNETAADYVQRLLEEEAYRKEAKFCCGGEVDEMLGAWKQLKDSGWLWSCFGALLRLLEAFDFDTWAFSVDRGKGMLLGGSAKTKIRPFCLGDLIKRSLLLPESVSCGLVVECPAGFTSAVPVPQGPEEAKAMVRHLRAVAAETAKMCEAVLNKQMGEEEMWKALGVVS